MKLSYLVQRALKMNYKAMLDKIGSIHKKTGRSWLAIFRDMQDCAVKYGAGYMDYDLFEMYNLTPEQRDTYLTRGRNNEIVAKYNDRAHMDDLGDKIKFNTKFAPFLHRDWVPVTGDNKADVLAFLGRHPQFMAKPSAGSCGWGIEKLNAADFPSLDDLYAHLEEKAPQLELEEVIQQHPAVAALFPGRHGGPENQPVHGLDSSLLEALPAAGPAAALGLNGVGVLLFRVTGPGEHYLVIEVVIQGGPAARDAGGPRRGQTQQAEGSLLFHG